MVVVSKWKWYETVLFFVRKQFYESIGCFATVLLFARLHPAAVFGIVIDFPIVHGVHDIYSHVIKFLMIENQQKLNEK